MASKLTPTQARSRKRRDALLTAAIELLAEGGARAVTHRAVAARAGLPAAATTYYFESIQELTEEALRRHVADRVAELRRLADDAARDADTIIEIAQKFVASFASRDRDVLIAQYEVYLEAARNPALRKPVADALGAFEDLAETVLGRMGARDPKGAARTMIALVDGFMLHHIASPQPDGYDTDGLFSAMRAVFVAEIADPEELDRWLAPLSTLRPRGALTQS